MSFKKIVGLIVSLIIIIFAGLELFADVHIPGLLPIAMAVFTLLQAQSCWKDYSDSKAKSHIAVAFGFMIACITCLFAGMFQVQNYVRDFVDVKTSNMHIDMAELTEEEKNITDLSGSRLGNAIFDFTADETIKAIQFNTYALKDGKWDRISGGGGNSFEESQGRLALAFKNIEEGLRTSIQGKGNHGSVLHKATLPGEFADMGRGTSYLSDETKIEYEKEIPLVVQIATNKNEMRSFDVEYFYKPEEYVKLDYEHVFAITVMFSQKTLEELS